MSTIYDRPYDVEAVAKAYYDRAASDRRRTTWDQLQPFVRSHYSGIVEDVVSCYEKHVQDLELEAKKKGKKAKK